MAKRIEINKTLSASDSDLKLSDVFFSKILNAKAYNSTTYENVSMLLSHNHVFQTASFFNVNISSETELESNSSAINKSINFGRFYSSTPFLFDRGDVQALLITFYVVVFIMGFVGNLIVLVVMWLHPRMQSSTNYFLTNLAIADFCVTIFCVLQNLSLYLAQSWIFGNFMCKMYNFINALSYTASVMILVVNCIERYIAIMSPFKAKTILRHRNLKIALIVVWIFSGIYCSPRLVYFRAVSHTHFDGQYEVICLVDRTRFSSKTFDTISFVLLYIVPLTVISVLYLRIARYLWLNSIKQENAIQLDTVDSLPSTTSNSTIKSFPSIRIHRGSSSNVNSDNTCAYENGERRSMRKINTQLRCHRGTARPSWDGQDGGKRLRENTESLPHSNEIIRRWQNVVKLLVAVVACFAVCNLPYHLRKMLIYYYPNYDVTSNEALLATPLTQLLMYLNSALNPILYCFMSQNFRFCIREVLTCQYTLRGKRRTVMNRNLRAQHLNSQRIKLEGYRFKRELTKTTNLHRTERF